MFDNHYTPDNYGILKNIEIFNVNISSYTFFVAFGIIVATVYYYFSNKEPNKSKHTYGIVCSALLGGLIGSKIPFILENIALIRLSNIANLLFTGKSIVGGLIGGYLGVIIYKKINKIESLRFGNEIAAPVALAMAIGRIGCFLSGCCYGIVVSRSFGVNFGDGLYRIPTQLIEATFCFVLFIYLVYLKQKGNLLPGELFKKLLLYYLSFRFIIEFIRDNKDVLGIFSIYQILSAMIVIFILLKERRKKNVL